MNGETGLRARGFVLSRNWVLPGALLLAAVASWAALHTSPGNGAYFPLVLMTLIMTAPFSVITLVRDALPLRRRAEVVVGEHGIAIDDAAPIAPEEIVEAKLVPRPGPGVGTVLELGVGKKRTRRVRVWMTEADALQAMKLLGTMPGERRTGFTIVAPYRTRFFACWGILLVLLTLTMVPMLFLGGIAASEFSAMFVAQIFSSAIWASILALLAGLVRGRVLVGSEGFATRWLRIERYRSFRGVARISQKGALGNPHLFDTLVEMGDGKKLRLSPLETPDTQSDVGTASRALNAHLTEALARYQRLSAEGSDARVALARSGRSGKDWLAAIDGVMRGGGARYRVAAVDPDQLAVLAKDPNAEPEARAGAAAALVRTGDPRHRSTVRIAAEACAVPELRVVLGELAEAEDDDVVAAALERAPKRAATR